MKAIVMMKTLKAILLTGSFFLVLNIGAEGEYIVCKDIGAGKIKCEDGVYGKTAEIGFTVPINGNGSLRSRGELTDIELGRIRLECGENNSNGTFDNGGRVVCNPNLFQNVPPAWRYYGEVAAQTENNGGGVSGAKKQEPTGRRFNRRINPHP